MKTANSASGSPRRSDVAPSAGLHELAVLWTMTKQGAPATCRAVTHPLGLELRLERHGNLIATGVFRQPEELIAQSRVWRELFEAKGWSPLASDAPRGT